MPIISLMTDFGIKDGNVGVMRGVIWGICPSALITDLSHMIPPQNIREAAYIFARSVPYFPKGSIHVVVVDPGVGTARRPMAAQIGDWFYVGPDNGTITGLLERAEREGWQTTFVELDQKKYWLGTISHVFHGRDIFSPVAAHLANGIPLADLGTSFNEPVHLELPKPEKTPSGWRGEVIHIDHFGSASTNIRIEDLGDAMKEKEKITIRVNGSEINGMVNTFGERPVGELIALIGSTGNLGIAVVNGSAVQRLGITVGDTVEVTYADIPR
ncbi:MAG TPA: SAM-dependent chlorinase/fluorinase [Anaerolineales bacterium]|nr:SAM-dependent chlorinase/fluorinase [Anaerolineales bacterium]